MNTQSENEDEEYMDESSLIREIGELQATNSNLQKLCEEQRVELEVERGISRSKNTELLEMSRKIEEQGRKVEAYDWAIGEWKKEEVLWKEREADLLMRLDALKGLASMGVADVIKERDNTLSQLATQTERIKELEHRAEVCQKFHGDVVDQTERIRELENKIEAMEYDAKEELPE